MLLDTCSRQAREWLMDDVDASSLLNSAGGVVLIFRSIVRSAICCTMGHVGVKVHKAFIHILDLVALFAFVGPVFNDVIPREMISHGKGYAISLHDLPKGAFNGLRVL